MDTRFAIASLSVGLIQSLPFMMSLSSMLEYSTHFSLLKVVVADDLCCHRPSPFPDADRSLVARDVVSFGSNASVDRRYLLDGFRREVTGGLANRHP